MHWKNIFAVYIIQKINHSVCIVAFLSWIKRDESNIKMIALDLVNLSTIHRGHLAVVFIRFTLPIPVIQVTGMVDRAIVCFDDKCDTTVVRKQCMDARTVVKNIFLIMMSSCDLHSCRVLLFVDILR